MITSTLKSALLITATSAIIVGGLYFQMDHHKVEPYFKRTFIQPYLNSSLTIPALNKAYIAGTTDTTIYIGVENSPLVEVIDLRSGMRKSLRLNHYNSNADEVFEIDSQSIHFINRETPSISYTLNADTSYHKTLTTAIPFIQCVPIHSSSYVLRTINASGQNVIVKINSKDIVSAAEEVLKEQKEGLYSTAGRLHYSTTLHRIVYLYYYRNEYIQYDTNLMVISKANTIDSNHLAKIKVIETTPGRFTPASPSSVVNRLSTVFQNYLFVCSNVRGVGESKNDFKTRSTIDVYDLSTTSYICSFYVNDYKNQRLNSFRVEQDRWIGVYDEMVVVHFMKFPQPFSFISETIKAKDILLAGKEPVTLVEKRTPFLMAGH